jgi:hypothetical protein
VPIYKFSIHDANGAHHENAGWMHLANESEAQEFAGNVIKDLLHGNAMRYANWTMDIAEGERAVASIALGRDLQAVD